MQKIGDIISKDGELRIITTTKGDTIPLQPVLDNLMTSSEIADQYHIADATVRIAIRNGYIKGVSKGNTHLIPRSLVEHRWAKTRDAKRS